MEHFHQNIDGWFNFENIYSRMVNDAKDDSIFIEVGSWKGKSSAYMATEIANSNKKISFYCVDTWRGSVENKNDSDVKTHDNIINVFTNNTLPVIKYINCIQMPSIRASRLFERNSLDFVFIDADHSYQAVKADILCWLPKVKLGGYIGGHDFDWPDVKNAVNDVLGKKFEVIPPVSWLMKV